MNSEEIKDTIFVGGIPYDMTLEDFEEEISTWGNVTKKYLKYHGGWGTVSFDSNSSRNRFLKDKSKHKLWNKLVDVKPYIYNPDKVKNSGPGHLVIGKGQVKMTTETSLKAKAEETKSNEAKNMSIIEKQMSDLQVNNQIESQTGAILKYIGDLDGVIRTPKYGDIAFSMESVYLCRLHKFYCRDSHCTNYLPLKKWAGVGSIKIEQQLPAGTTVSFFYRPIVFKDLPEYKYQATLVWPQASKKPSSTNLLSVDELNQSMVRFSVDLVRSKTPAWTNSLSKSSSPSPSPSTSNGASASAITSKFALNFASSLMENSKVSKFNYDVPLEDLLDDGGDDLDSEAEILMWIKDFLQNELGKLGGNVPMLLMNNIRSLGSDELVLQEIVSFAKSKQIVIDNAKRESISQGLKHLRRRIRGLESPDFDKSLIMSAVCSSEKQSANSPLENYADHELNFIYNMPLNHEYLSVMELFYAKFLKSENLEFRMDFDTAFKKLSPLMAFKSFNWILDWMTNDRRKKLRQFSDLKDYNDSEEIIGALEQFLNNLKVLKSKNLLKAFFNQDEEKTAKMLIYYIKHHITDVKTMNMVLRVIKDMKNIHQYCSGEEFIKSHLDRGVVMPELSSDYLITDQFEIKNPTHVQRHYERLWTFLDQRLDLQGSEFVNESITDYEFQKLALLYPWYQTSTSLENLEDNVMKCGGNIYELQKKWIQTCLLETPAVDPGAVAKKTMDYLADKMDLSKKALEFAWSMTEHQGFVAEYFGDLFGLVFTVKGEVVIFEKSTMFLQTKDHSWRNVRSLEEVRIGTYVKLRAKIPNVAAKVWVYYDTKTEEPLKQTSKVTKGEKYYTTLFKNYSRLSGTFPALKSIVGPKATLKNLYFSNDKTFSYMSNVYKRNTYDPYLESKETLSGDHSEAVDILASKDIGLDQLTALFMASKLLGYEGHEKLFDILATINVGVPDPINFATDLTAFFDDNCKKEVQNIKIKAKNDTKQLLKYAESYLNKSGLCFDPVATAAKEPTAAVSSSSPMTSTSVTKKPFDNHGGSSHGQHDFIVNGNGDVEELKLAALEKNISILNKEVKSLKNLDELSKQMHADLAHFKRDQDAKHVMLKQSLQPILEKLTELSVDVEALKTEVKTMKGLKLPPGAPVAPIGTPGTPAPIGTPGTPTPIGQEKVAKNNASSKNHCVYVRVSLPHNTREVHEFPTDENGNLSFTAVNAVYPGVNALKFESKETRSIRLCRKIGDIFEPPEDGWGDRTYWIHSPLTQAASNVNTFATAPPTFAPTSTFAPSSSFAPLFSGYPLSAANLTGNPFSTNSLTGSMFKQ